MTSSGWRLGLDHSIALQRRYYRLCKGYIAPEVLQAHNAKLRRHVKRFASWQRLGSQAVQDVVDRLAEMLGKVFIQIDRWERTTQRCSGCKRQLSLRERRFGCAMCGLDLDRDHNAAHNIRSAGASALVPRGVSRAQVGLSV